MKFNRGERKAVKYYKDMHNIPPSTLVGEVALRSGIEGKWKKTTDWWKSFESICPLLGTSLPQHISFSWTRHNSHSLRWRIRKLEFKPNESFSCLTPFPLYVVCSLVSTLHAHYVNIWTWTLGRKIWFSTRDFWSFPSWKLWCSKHIHIKCLCAAEIINQRDL